MDPWYKHRSPKYSERNLHLYSITVEFHDIRAQLQNKSININDMWQQDSRYVTKELIFTSNAPHRSTVWSASIQRDFTAKIIFWNRNRHVFIIHLYAHLCSVFPRGITPWCFNLSINLFNLQRRSLFVVWSQYKKREERNHFNINITNRLNAANERHWRFRYIASDVEVFIKNSNSIRSKNLIDPYIFECKFS